MGRKKGSRAIKPTIKGTIVFAALNDFQKPRRTLAIELQSTIKKMGEIVPDEETIERLISSARNNEPDPQDAPWTVLALSEPKQAIQPEVLPTVLRLYAYATKNKGYLTIREVLWISRLYYVFKEFHTERGALSWEDSEGQIRHWEEDSLLIMAREYAMNERTYRILSNKFPDMNPKMWFQSLTDSILTRLATNDDKVLETAIKQLMQSIKDNQEKYLQWNQRILQIQKEEEGKNEKQH